MFLSDASNIFKKSSSFDEESSCKTDLDGDVDVLGVSVPSVVVVAAVVRNLFFAMESTTFELDFTLDKVEDVGFSVVVVLVASFFGLCSLSSRFL